MLCEYPFLFIFYIIPYLLPNCHAFLRGHPDVQSERYKLENLAHPKAGERTRTLEKIYITERRLPSEFGRQVEWRWIPRAAAP